MLRKALGLLIVTFILASAAGVYAAEPETASFTIKVQSSGDVRVTPDMAQMWIGVQTDAETASEALAENNRIVGRLTEIFVQYTRPEVVKTSEFNLYRRERWDSETQRSVPDGFTIRHVFEVAVFDLEKVAQLMDDITAAGANIIYGLQYGLQEPSTARAEAYANAVAKAKEQAQALAEAAGGTTPVLEKLEETYYYGPVYAAEGGAGVSENATAFMPGQLKVSVSIEATFRSQLTVDN
ncbi:MAG TPA: SIMPL domain-containing protein [Firmicutes bacterium]|jgi:uncharacterized protein YggE|nr:MAG: hypothetical protein AA931_07680 [Peptococcaceae bacterium 1109]HHT73947.1 SIMPL domain-containing protein [Bacillota bacterium]